MEGLSSSKLACEYINIINELVDLPLGIRVRHRVLVIGNFHAGVDIWLQTLNSICVLALLKRCAISSQLRFRKEHFLFFRYVSRVFFDDKEVCCLDFFFSELVYHLISSSRRVHLSNNLFTASRYNHLHRLLTRQVKRIQFQNFLIQILIV